MVAGPPGRHRLAVRGSRRSPEVRFPRGADIGLRASALTKFDASIVPRRDHAVQPAATGSHGSIDEHDHAAVHAERANLFV